MPTNKEKKKGLFIPFGHRLETLLLGEQIWDSMFIKKPRASLPSLCERDNTGLLQSGCSET